MPGVERVELLVLTAHQVHNGCGLGQGADVILFARDTQQRTRNVREVDPAPTKLDGSLHELVLLDLIGGEIDWCGEE